MSEGIAYSLYRVNDLDTVSEWCVKHFGDQNTRWFVHRLFICLRDDHDRLLFEMAWSDALHRGRGWVEQNKDPAVELENNRAAWLA
jgi:hypothetical protein